MTLSKKEPARRLRRAGRYCGLVDSARDVFLEAFDSAEHIRIPPQPIGSFENPAADYEIVSAMRERICRRAEPFLIVFRGPLQSDAGREVFQARIRASQAPHFKWGADHTIGTGHIGIFGDFKRPFLETLAVNEFDVHGWYRGQGCDGNDAESGNRPHALREVDLAIRLDGGPERI